MFKHISLGLPLMAMLLPFAITIVKGAVIQVRDEMKPCRSNDMTGVTKTIVVGTSCVNIGCDTAHGYHYIDLSGVPLKQDAANKITENGFDGLPAPGFQFVCSKGDVSDCGTGHVQCGPGADGTAGNCVVNEQNFHMECATCKSGVSVGSMAQGLDKCK